jgi:hypothetical protein
MTEGPCAMRGLLHGPLVSIRSAWPAGNPREVRATALRRSYWTATGTRVRLDRGRFNSRGRRAEPDRDG